MRGKIQKYATEIKAQQDKLAKQFDEVKREHGSLLRRYHAASTDQQRERLDKKLSAISKKSQAVMMKLNQISVDVDAHVRERFLKVRDPAIINLGAMTGGWSDSERKKVNAQLGVFRRLLSVKASSLLKSTPSADFDRLPVGSPRGWYSYDERTIHLPPNAFDAPKRPLHELGHWLEGLDESIYLRAEAFLEQRTKGEKAEKLNKITGLPFYGEKEIAKKDRFLDPYMGKIYPDVGATEIVSMGIEYLATRPLEFAQRDPEYFDLIFNMLRGLPS